MKHLLLFVTIFFTLCANAQIKNTIYSDLATGLNADEYGMKGYTLVILKTGSNKTASDAEKQEYFKSHFKNMQELSDEGKLIIAGPLRDTEQNYRGLFIFNSTDKDSVTSWIMKDETILNKIFDYEIIEWYGSAALPLYLPFHNAIEQKKH